MRCGSEHWTWDGTLTISKSSIVIWARLAAAAELRAGFKEVVAQVTLGQVGIILSSEVTRLSRNCSDWYPLLDICSYKSCLIADRDGIYDPGSANGRLLLGIKGQLSELELHTIRGRMWTGLLNKAQRGELALRLPVGLVRDAQGRVVKDPNQEVQNRIGLVFHTFLRVKSAGKTLRFFSEQDLKLPRPNRFGDVVWKKPTLSAILLILRNPAYAGAFVYGRTRTNRELSGKTSVQPLPMKDWKIVVKDTYPAYLDWETFERIQAILADNYAEYDHRQSRGAPHQGELLLQGLVYCGECGHKMVVAYQERNRYQCQYQWQVQREPVCQNIPAELIDEQVVQAFFQALSPIELDAYEQTLLARQETNQEIERAQAQQLKRLQYEAALAERQYQQVDPDNRLVAAELENRWEAALVALKQAEESFARAQADQPSLAALSVEIKEAFMAIGQKLPHIWNQEDVLSTAQKKALLRCLIDKVVIHRTVPDQVQTRIVWRGGATTTLQIPVTVGALTDLSNLAEMEQIIADLARGGQSDDDIAAHLTQLGYRSPRNPKAVLPSTVQTIRLQLRIFKRPNQSKSRLFRVISPFPNWPKPWISPCIGSTTASARTKSTSRKTKSWVYTYSPIIRIHWSSSSCSNPAFTRSCVFNRASR